MKTFTDNTGRKWTIEVNVQAIKRVRGLIDVDLMDAVGGDLIERLLGDPVLLCDVVYCLCKPEADERGISDEEVGRAMAGDAIEEATEALLEELVDFFPPKKRALLRKAMDKLDRFQDAAIELAHKKLDDPELEATLRKELDRLAVHGSSCGDLPESLDSIQDPSP